jgi:hypothetical protein
MIIHSPGHDPTLPKYEFKFADGTIETLAFDRETWTYYRLKSGASQPLDGVTRVLHRAIDKSIPIGKWMVNQALDRVRAFIKPYIITADMWPAPNQKVYFKPLYEEVLDKALELAKKEPDKKLEEASGIGTQAHNHLEAIVKATMAQDALRLEELLSKMPEDDRASTAVTNALKWFDDHDVQFISAERKVYNRRLGCAGTADLVCRVSSCQDPKCCPYKFKDVLALVDFKTSNGTFASQLCQVALYGDGLNQEMEFVAEQITHGFLLRIDKIDAKFEHFGMDIGILRMCLLGFEHALLLCRDLDKIDEWMSHVKADRKAAAALEKAQARLIACPKSDSYLGKGPKSPVCGCTTCMEKWRKNHPEKA